MRLSYTEEIVSEYYRHLTEDKKTKYIVSEKIKYPGPRGSRKDIDVLAVGLKDICIVETKWHMHGSKEKMDSLCKSFNVAEEYVKKQFYSKRKKIRKIFIVNYYSPKKLLKKLQEAGIETMELKDIAKELIRILDKDGRGEESNVTSTLGFLLEHEFIEKKKYQK